MRRSRLGLAVVVIVVLVAVGVLAVAAARGEGESLADRLGLEGRDEAAVEGSGFIEAPRVAVASEVPGTVVDVLVADGDRVRQGEALVSMMNNLLDAQVKQAEAGVMAARARLDQLRAGPPPVVLAEARDAETRALAALDEARRAVDASPAGAAAEAAREAQAAALAVAEAATAQRELLEAGPSPFQLRLAEAGVRQADARLKRARADASGLSVVAPMDGVISSVAARSGEMVAPGAPLLYVSREGPVELTVYVPERRLADVSVGQAATVTVDGLPDESFDGEIASIGTSAEFTPRNVQTAEGRSELVFAVRITVPNGDGRLKPGMAARAVIEAE